MGGVDACAPSTSGRCDDESRPSRKGADVPAVAWSAAAAKGKAAAVPVCTAVAPPSRRRSRPPSQARVDLATYAVTATFCLLATRQTSTVESKAVASAMGAAFLAAAVAAARGGPAYARHRAALAVLLRLVFCALHNPAVYLNRFYEIKFAVRTWPAFFMARTGPLMFSLLNASVGLPRGPGLAALLAAEWALLAATQWAACFSQAGWTSDFTYFYNKVTDVFDAASALGWAAVLGGGAGERCAVGAPPAAAAVPPAMASPALKACTIHACRLVLGAMYAAGAVLSYSVAPRRPRPPRASRGGLIARLEAAAAAAVTAAFVAGVAWTAAAAVLSRPVGCAGAAAAAGWASLEASSG